MSENVWQWVDDEIAAHPAVSKIYKLGYRIKYTLLPERPILEVQAWTTRYVGKLRAEINRELAQVHADNIVVMSGHERRGLGTAMMVCVEQITGLVMVPAGNQTDAGRALWNQPNRPFGNQNSSTA
jgi:hypothetical protein